MQLHALSRIIKIYHGSIFGRHFKYSYCLYGFSGKELLKFIKKKLKHGKHIKRNNVKYSPKQECDIIYEMLPMVQNELHDEVENMILLLNST